jgi:hypothetical protein
MQRGTWHCHSITSSACSRIACGMAKLGPTAVPCRTDLRLELAKGLKAHVRRRSARRTSFSIEISCLDFYALTPGSRFQPKGPAGRF